MGNKILLFVLVAVFVFPFVFAVDIDACKTSGWVADTIYNLNQTVNTTGHCFDNFQAANVTVDCQGYNITGVNDDNKYGILIDSGSIVDANLTFRNCNFYNFSRGINLNGKGNHNFVNISVYNSSQHAIYFSNGAHNNNFTNILISNISSATGNGVALWSGSTNNTFDNIGFHNITLF